MTKLMNYILSPKGQLDEMTYEANIGFTEMVEFYRKASTTEIDKMENIVSDNDWDGFKQLIRKVTGKVLK